MDPQVLQPASPASAGASESRAWARRLVREMSLQDWLVVVYLCILTCAVLSAQPSPTKVWVLERVTAMLGFAVTTLVLVRGGLLKHRFLAPLGYRLAVYGMLQLSYFLLRELLPLVNPGTLDAELVFIDKRVLHLEPALWMDQFVTPRATEWFAFFYFGYFFLLAIHVLPMMLLSRRTKLLAEFSLGMLSLYAITHTLYMVVPGYGPVKHLADQFHNPLPEGFWLRMVLNAVESGGAQKDIFPSLHTAGPTFIALFSYRHRDELPFKYTWPLVTFFAANIVGATMFLRWHYLIDVLAGLTLASLMAGLAARIAPREVAAREKAGLTPVWTPLFDRRAEPIVAEAEAPRA